MSSILVRSLGGRRSGVALLAALALVAGCRAPEERAAKYAGMYEAAMAANDPWTARLAMQTAVRYEDANPQYWEGLGRAQLALGDYGAAFGSFLRANELDRSNVGVLQTLADLAVMAGQVDQSRRYANQVLLLTPGDPAPQSTLGYIALHELKFEDALKRADTVLGMRPGDSNATVLKARALAALDRQPEAVALLKAHVAGHLDDRAALQAMSAIAGREGDLAGRKLAQSRLLELSPNDPAVKLDLARTLYALGERDHAHAMTLAMAEQGRHGGQLIDILALWRRYEPRDATVAEVRRLATAASIADRMRYAYYLMMAGEPAEAEAMVAAHAALPVTAANAAPLALLAQTRAAQGRDKEALSLLDAVLAFDNSNVLALRARTDLYLRAGRGKAAVPDAQRLVAEKPKAADDRVRLARAYRLAGQPQLAENAYRAGLQEVPGSPLIYRHLRRFLAETGKQDELADLDREYGEQKRATSVQL